jgi:hypothetical protein
MDGRGLVRFTTHSAYIRFAAGDFAQFRERLRQWRPASARATERVSASLQLDQTGAASFARLALLLAIALGTLVGCQSVGSFAGWAVTGASSLAAVRPACLVEEGKARICRGDSNALQIAVSPQKRNQSLESWTRDQYLVQLTFTTNDKTGTGQPFMQFPLLQSTGISDVSLLKDQNQNKLIVSFLANSLGLDLLGASLTSPRGLSGVFVLGSRGTSLLSWRRYSVDLAIQD